MELGTPSISLAVKDLEASRRFYEKLGYVAFAGNPAQHWLIVRNGDHVIGLFQGMFERNIMTFNPGWDGQARPLATFTDVRELQRRLKAQGVPLAQEADESGSGPASFVAIDPDGNPILIDQHVPAAGPTAAGAPIAARAIEPPAEVAAYYASFPEESRLEMGPGQLERDRTRDILERILPPPPARIVDVGGAAGVYSLWLAERGYEVHLVDAAGRLVEEARGRSAQAPKPLASATVADARRLPQESGFAAAVLVMGPLYHLPAEEDRIAALREAHRVLASGGVAVVAGISRFASALDGVARRLALDPRFVAIRDRDLVDGQHRNETGVTDYFTTAYFHRPDELGGELAAARFKEVRVLGVEGPGWILGDFEERWANPALRKDLLDVARAMEAEPSIVGMSAHLLAIGRKP